MAQTTLSVRMDDSLKSDFDKVCNELGLSMTTAITMLAKKMTREKRLPFEVSVDPFYSEENLARLRRSIAQMESTGGTVHEVNLDDLSVDRCGLGGFRVLDETRSKDSPVNSSTAQGHRPQWIRRHRQAGTTERRPFCVLEP